MKYIYTLFIALATMTSANAQNFFFEDFDGCTIPTDWTNTAIVGDTAWVFGNNAGGSPGGSVDGTCMAYLHDDDLGSAYPAVVADLVSPSIDLTSLDTALLQFDYIFEDLGTSYFAVALWNGADWDTVFTENSDPGCFGFFPTCGPRSASISIADYLIADFQIKFIFSDGNGWNWYVGLDNVAIYVPPTDDAVASSAVAPLTGCGLSATETVSIVVYNNGQNDITDIEAGFQVGGQTETETFTVSIGAAESDTLVFTATVDLSVPGEYDFTAWVSLDTDLDNLNDTISFSISSIPVIASLPYSEDFENGAGGWVSGGTLDPWELGDPETAFIDTANSGINAWVTNLDGTYENSTAAYVESPCFDFSNLVVDPVLRLAFIANSEVGWDGTWIEVSTDAGSTWNTVGNVGEGTNWYTNEDEHGANFDEDWWDSPFGAANEWTTATHLIDGAAGSGSVKIRVFFISDGSINAGYEGFAFDDIEIFEQPSINAGVTEILSPITGCGLGTELVTVVIENFGDADLVDFDVAYEIEGLGVVTETISDTLFAASVDTFTFTVPVDLSVIGDYDLGAWTAVIGDGDTTNDSIFSVVTSIPVVSSLPYLIDFESGSNGWYSTGINGNWELGDPEGIIIDTANSGVNAWATNLDSLNYANGQLSYLTSPCFDLSSLVIDPILEFAFISNTEIGWDGMWVEVSTDAGATWSTVGNFDEGTNWYNNEDEHGVNFDEDWWDGTTTGGWIVAEHLLDGVAGSSDVIVRFVFSSDLSVNNYEGFAIDDISLTEQPPINASVFEITSPVSACGLTDSEVVSATITNLGSIDLDSLVVSYSFNNGPIVTEVFNDTVNPTNSFSVDFAQLIDLSVPGDYELTVWVTAVGEGDASNDTLTVQITSVPTISSLPYEEDFENGTGGWRSVGLVAQWELGDPEGTLIDTAFSGVNAWATNLNTFNYENGEISMLMSPCLDFSNLTEDPVMSFAIQYDSETNWDGTWLEVSTNGGASWTVVGNLGEGENWYTSNNFFNAIIPQGWTGQSGQAGEWVIAEHILDGVAGSADVQVRFIFSSDASVNFFEGFAIDDISIFAQPQLDLVALSIDAPSSGCSLGEESVTMTFWNKGLQTVSGFELGFIVDAGIPQYETYTGSVANGDTVTYTFASELADLSIPGIHTVDVFTALMGDERLSSDSVFGHIVLNNGSVTPLSQTEEPIGAVLSSTIPQGTTSKLFFCGLPTALDGCFEIVSLSIDSLSHTWLADLDIYLISPEGDSLEISTGNGGSGDNMYNVVFTDSVSTSIATQTAGILPGYYTIEDTAGFAALYNGQDPNGPWTLWIDDNVGGDDGQLISWTLTFRDNSPQPQLAYSDTSICLTQVLTVETGEFDSYLWSTGNNSQEIDLFGNILGLGTHEIYVTVDQDGCTGVSNSFILTVDACAGIDELDGLTIDVYPNPTTGNIVLDIVGDSDGFAVSVTDMNGKSVHTETIGKITTGIRSSIDLSQVANGIYFLRLDDGNSFTTRKLIKQ
jgi:subtilisin-like proprotein convertase family protein